MKVYLSILCFIICLSGLSQKKGFDIRKKYSVKQVLEDIDYTEKYLVPSFIPIHLDILVKTACMPLF
jgi:hypothetical protein